MDKTDKTKDRPDIFHSSGRTPKQWYVLFVKSRNEKKIDLRLKEDGYKTFLPLKKELRYRKQRKVWVEEPLFRSYLFIKVRAHQLYDVLQYPEVLTVVKNAGEPSVVKEKTLLLIKKLLISETTFEVEKNAIKPGHKIKLKTGPFKGFEGTIKELRGKKQLVVEIPGIQYSLVIKMEDLLPPKE